MPQFPRWLSRQIDTQTYYSRYRRGCIHRQRDEQESSKRVTIWATVHQSGGSSCRQATNLSVHDHTRERQREGKKEGSRGRLAHAPISSAKTSYVIVAQSSELQVSSQPQLVEANRSYPMPVAASTAGGNIGNSLLTVRRRSCCNWIQYCNYQQVSSGSEIVVRFFTRAMRIFQRCKLVCQ